MDYFARRKQELSEAMESCRAGGDDLSDPHLADLAAALADDPELRARFARLQRSDAAIKIAFAKVTVPADLSQRVLRRLAEAAPVSPVAAVDPIQVSAATTSASPAPLRPDHVSRDRVSRRRLLVGFAALSASAALLTAVWLRTHQPAPITPGRVIDEAMDFFGHDNAPAGELVSRVAPPAEFPVSHDIRQSSLVRWRRVATFLGGEAVAYDLPAINGRATLYVVNRTVAGLPAFPPSSPLTTGGNAAAAWQQGGMLYVLVVQGDAGTYAEYLDHTSGPLT